MKRRMGSLIIWVCFLGVFTMATACAEKATDDHDAEITSLLNRGKMSLAKNEWSAAKADFEKVLAKYDPSNSEAHFGAALADVLFLSDILRYVAGLGGDTSATSLLPLADDESRYLNGLISDAIATVHGKFQSAGAHLSAIETGGQFEFNIETLPLFLSTKKTATVDLGGAWDRSDALLVHGVVNLALAAVDIVESIDVNFDFPRAHAYLTQPDFDASRTSHLISLLAYLLNDPNYPHFLALKSKGAKNMENASAELAAAVRALELALYSASRETDSQDNDILRFEDINGDGRFTPAYEINADGCSAFAKAKADPKQKNRFDSATATRPDGFSLFGVRLGSSRAYPFMNEQVICVLQIAYVNLAWSQRSEFPTSLAAAYATRPRLNVIHDLLPVIDALISAISSAQPEITFGVPVPEGIIGEVVANILGDAVELDPHAFFAPDTATKLPATIRGLLPAWESSPCPVTGLCFNTFAIEMECSPLPVTLASFPTPITEAFGDFQISLPACKETWIDGDQFQDTAHFDNAIAADQIVGYLPYIGFQDAGLHGLLYLNLSAMAGRYADSQSSQDTAISAGLNQLDGDAQFTPATLAQLNALLAAVSANGNVSSILLKLAEQAP